MALGCLHQASLYFSNPSGQEGKTSENGQVSSANTSTKLPSQDRTESPWLMYLRASKYMSHS